MQMQTPSPQRALAGSLAFGVRVDDAPERAGCSRTPSTGLLSPPHTPRLPPTTPSQRDGSEAANASCGTCAVCLSPVTAGPTTSSGETVVPVRRVLITVCNHTFHKDCLVRCRLQRLVKDQSLPCPLCRATLPPGLTPSPAARRALMGLHHDALQFRGDIRDMVTRCRLAREAVSARWLAQERERVQHNDGSPAPARL